MSRWLTDPGKGGWPEATAEELAEAERLWLANMRNIAFQGPHVTAKAILSGALKHAKIPELSPLSAEALAEIRGLHKWTSGAFGCPIEITPGAVVAGYDVNGMFPSAGACELGTEDPERFDDEASLPSDWTTMPGYVRLASTPAGLPYGLDTRLSAGLWVPVPIAAYLLKRGHALALDAGLLWARHRRWLGVHNRIWREARAALAPMDGRPAAMAHQAVKAVHVRMFGGLLASEKHGRTVEHDQGELLRPDWRDMIIATAWVRMWLGLDKAGLDGRVIAFNVDTALVALPDTLTDRGHPAGLAVCLSREETTAGTAVTTEAPELGKPGKFKELGRAVLTEDMAKAARVGIWRPVLDAVKAGRTN
jgi:hypothetical protein